MSKYEYLIENISVVEGLTKRGVLSLTVMRDMDIYMQFREMDGFSFQARYAVLSHDFELSTQRIEQIISNLSK